MKKDMDGFEERYKKERGRRKKSREKIIKKCAYLEGRKEPFTLTVVNGNYTLDSILFKERMFRKGIYTPDELNFFKRVRRHVLDNEVHLMPQFEEQILRSEVRYVDVDVRPSGTVLNDVLEIDLDEAYWKTANLFGVISDDIYKLGAKGTICKQARMTALGTLAKKTGVIKYDGEGFVKETESDPLLENLWFTICKRIGDLMFRASNIAGKEFVFYWVDGIYIINTTENKRKISKMFKDAGYAVKYKKVDKVVFGDKGFTCYDDKLLEGTNEQKKRYFNFPPSKSKRSISYSESLILEEYMNNIINGRKN
jgi:hypothetical protein